jgi:nucleoside 2-deoxyribosyltransferase
MIITICGSINCSDKLIEAAEKLESLGHTAHLPYYTKKIRSGELKLEDFNKAKAKNGDAAFREAASEDLIKRYYRLISESDAILIVNVEKNGQSNYIGGNAFLEMGFAYVLDKPFYLLNDIPQIGYKDEIIAMKPIILGGQLGKIK